MRTYFDRQYAFQLGVTGQYLWILSAFFVIRQWETPQCLWISSSFVIVELLIILLHSPVGNAAVLVNMIVIRQSSLTSHQANSNKKKNKKEQRKQTNKTALSRNCDDKSHIRSQMWWEIKHKQTASSRNWDEKSHINKLHYLAIVMRNHTFFFYGMINV